MSFLSQGSPVRAKANQKQIEKKSAKSSTCESFVANARKFFSAMSAIQKYANILDSRCQPDSSWQGSGSVRTRLPALSFVYLSSLMHYPRAFKGPGTYSPRKPHPHHGTNQTWHLAAATFCSGKCHWRKTIINRCTGMSLLNSLAGAGVASKFLLPTARKNSELKSGYWRGFMWAFHSKLYIITSYHLISSLRKPSRTR